MKKIFIIIIFCFAFLPLCLNAQERARFRMPDRIFEIGIANGSAGFSNDFFSIRDFLKETAEININRLDKGFNLTFGLDITPFHFALNIKNKWGFGLSIGLDAIGNVGLSGNMLTLGEAAAEKSEVSGAAFLDAQISVFFHISRFKIKLGPSVYYPLLYADSSVTYSYDSTGNSIGLNYNSRIYTPVSLENGFNISGIFSQLSARPGVDISLGLEYPLAQALGKKNFSLLDITIGADFFNIPIYSSRMKDYMEISGEMSVSADILAGEFDYSFVLNETVYGTGDKSVRRPFTMLVWAQWRPVRVLHFIPTVGFSINPFYEKPFSMEYGLKTRLDLANIFIMTFGVGYHDRIWRNSLDFTLNFRVLELNFGVDMRSPKFLESWRGYGFGASFGIKLGW